MTDSPQLDRFVHNRLPAADQWPDILPIVGIHDADTLNCVSFLLDRHIAAGHGQHPAVHGNERTWSYLQLSDHVSRLARVMVQEFGVQPGNRVLIRGDNSPDAMVVWLAIQKIGAIAVTTMSLLRETELSVIVEISQPCLAVCEAALLPELELVIRGIAIISYSDGTGELFDLMETAEPLSQTCPTLPDDISLIAFTSGTTGRPKATVHFHRDIIAICETMARHIVNPSPVDVFIGTAPLAFTFGLGGLLVFPLYFGASSVLLPRYMPEQLLEAIDRFQATVCFTVPTFYQQMAKLKSNHPPGSLRLAVSSGEALPLPVRHAWLKATGMTLAEVLGSTEMLHAFAGAAGDNVREGFIGPAFPGFELAILDETENPLPPGETGRLAVKGPTGCRYLDDDRQKSYVHGGWNITGDACSISADGYLAYHSRMDDMIISSGYNISGVEVENALLLHPAVNECAVIGEPSEERGQIVSAFVVTARVYEGLREELQAHVKQVIAPYKYPREVSFVDHLPRNESGKIQRFRLRRNLDETI